MRAVILLALVGCRQALGIPSGGSLAGEGEFAIRVEVVGATGATGGAQVLLTHSASDDTTVETLSDETTVLVTKLADGEDFEIVGMSGNCRVVGGRGTIASADASGVEITCDGLAALDDFGFTAPLTFDPAFDGSENMPRPQASILVQQTSWAPLPRHDDAAIDRAAYAGQLGAGPFPIAPGMAWEVELSNQGFARMYHADPVVSAPLAYAYGKPSVVTAEEHFGSALAVFDRELVVGGKGVVAVFARTGRDWVEVQRITGPPGFGASVALTADRLAVGTPGIGVDIYQRAGDTWQPLRSLAPPTDGTAAFATAVVIEAADRVIVGDPECRATGCIVRYVGTTPTVVGVGRAGDRFGASLALSGVDLVVGAPGDDSAIPGDPTDTQFADAGAAYAFRLPDLSQHEYLKSDAPGVDDRFGAAVGIEVTADVALLVVGAPLEDSAGADPDDNSQPASGAAYVFRRQASWTLAARLKAPNANFGDNFGAAVAIRSNTLAATTTCVVAIGAPFEDSGSAGDEADESKPDSGAVYVFPVAVDGTAAAPLYGKGSSLGAFDALGSSLALTTETLVAGAPFEDSSRPGWNPKGDEAAHDAGAVYAFR